ncbi:hypothetical protein LZK82_12890 [Rhizobium leguminosarum]|nr:hypothetical protein LZK82_12890 [Rhizobium leguminosarum]
MAVFEKRQIDVSANANSPGSYAPSVFFKDAREGLTKSALEAAMKSLIDKGIIEVVVIAKGTTREKRLLKLTGGGDAPKT